MSNVSASNTSASNSVKENGEMKKLSVTGTQVLSSAYNLLVTMTLAHDAEKNANVGTASIVIVDTATGEEKAREDMLAYHSTNSHTLYVKNVRSDSLNGVVTSLTGCSPTEAQKKGMDLLGFILSTFCSWGFNTITGDRDSEYAEMSFTDNANELRMSNGKSGEEHQEQLLNFSGITATLN